MKPVMILADFDETIIDIDSFASMMKQEKWYLDPAVLLCGAGLVLTRMIGKDQLPARSRMKKRLMEKYRDLPADKRKEYIDLLRNHIDPEVVAEIKALSAEKLIIASASEEELIRDVLAGILEPDDIIANEFGGEDFRTCWGREKAERFIEKYPHYEEYDIHVFTDSQSDRPIMELADHVHMIERG